MSWAGTCGLYSRDLEYRGEYLYCFVGTWDGIHLKRVCVLIDDGPRVYPVCELRIWFRVQSCLTSSVRLCCLNGGSALLPQSVDGYLDDRKRLIHYKVFLSDLYRTCVGRVGIIVFGKLDTFKLVQYLVWLLKSAKHDDWLLSSPYMRLGVMRGCVELADSGHVVLENILLWFTIQFFLRKTSRVGLNVRNSVSVRVDCVLYCDDVMLARPEFFVVIYIDCCSSFRTWFAVCSDFRFRYHGKRCKFCQSPLVKIYDPHSLPPIIEWRLPFF